MQRFIKSRFEILAEWISRNLGHPYAFLMALVTVLLWGVLGPLFGFSDTWQLVINTSTTIVTFLMVFLLQNTGNRGIEQMDQRIQLLEAQNQQLLHAIQRLTQVVEHK